jgi:hypothetical protein
MCLLYFFIPAVWQGYAKHSSFFQNPMGWLWVVFCADLFVLEKAVVPPNVQAQRSPPGTRPGCNRRVEILRNRPNVQRGGGSLQHTC